MVKVAVLGYGMVKVLLPNSAISLYGNRAEGAVEIPDARFTKTNELIKENEFIISIISKLKTSSLIFESTLFII